MANSLLADERAVSPVVAKTLAAGLALFYIAGMTGLLAGSIVPQYQEASGEELAERVLASAAETIEHTPPQATGTVNTTSTIELPETIAGHSYRIKLSGRQLSVVHPDSEIDATTRLSLPAGATVENSTWQSTAQFTVRVSGPTGNRTVQIDT